MYNAPACASILQDKESFYSRQVVKSEYASYLFMCPIAVLIVTLGLFSSGLNT